METLPEMYLGQHVSKLPTPALVIDEEKFNANCNKMLGNILHLAEQTSHPILFRAHIKTHKTTEGTLRQLGFEGTPGKIRSKAVLVSTIKEANGILDFQEFLNKNFVDDIAFSLPSIIPETLESLSTLSTRVANLRIFIDNIEHLENLKKFGKPASGKKWSVFIKLDMGTHRAGLDIDSQEFFDILDKLQEKDVQDVATLYGFYAHAGHSYGSKTIQEANGYLLDEIKAVNTAAEIASSFVNPKALVLSVGATPTSNALSLTENKKIISYIKEEMVAPLEIHCGNYPCYDLQQYSTGCIKLEDISSFVLGSIISKYPKRNEALTNTGVLALARESSSTKGLGLSLELENYLSNRKDFKVSSYIDRVSQEHGILKPWNGKEGNWTIGEKVAMLPQHACITMAQFPYYFVINTEGVVVDLWKPHQKW